MASTFWVAIAIIAVVSIVSNAVVKVFSGAKGGKRTKHLEADLARLENDLDEALERIVVLEKIVTDEKHSLRREINDLAS